MICTCRDPMSLGVVHRADAPCYLPEPKREWQGLTDEERVEILRANGEAAVLYLTEAKLRSKNGY